MARRVEQARSDASQSMHRQVNLLRVSRGHRLHWVRRTVPAADSGARRTVASDRILFSAGLCEPFATTTGTTAQNLATPRFWTFPWHRALGWEQIESPDRRRQMPIALPI